MDLAQKLAAELSVDTIQATAAISLLDEGATVPFIARYRKEATGALSDSQLRLLAERLIYLRELEDRRDVVLRSIEDQGKLSIELKAMILDADSKQRLEDLYLPYKPKRRTKAQVAREAGLEPLAMQLWRNPDTDPETCALQYVRPENNVSDTQTALDGARHILSELFAEDVGVLTDLRALLWEQGVLSSTVVPGKESEGVKFTDYFGYSETISTVPSHRALALFRGRNNGILKLQLDLPGSDSSTPNAHPAETRVAVKQGIGNCGRRADSWLLETVRWCWRTKLHHTIQSDLFQRLREAAETTAIDVFAHNIKDLLLAAPAGPRVTMGLDPGLRTGVKAAVVDATGKLLDTATIYPHAPRNDWEGSLRALNSLVQKHGVQLISIGNGTASRETDKLAADLLRLDSNRSVVKVVVSEAGASVYSASELAAQEFPNLDVTLRGAVSIARRLQDPLAELVKIDPKSIGVGQYQHDVNQVHLGRKLTNVVEDCVNAVGVDVNTASSELLASVSGLSGTLAQNIVKFRDEHGPFANRSAIKNVPRMGAKTFEQAAGFLRIASGENPLDSSAVHPEAYALAERVAAFVNRDVRSLIGDSDTLRALDPRQFTDAQFGLPTVQDILKELEKPGRDPRPEFKTAGFMDGVENLQDLKPGLLLEGVVTNVTNFGAFVDIGVHQDGLVHISALADKYVKDPRQIVSTGMVVKVKVLDVDVQRKRVALTMRLNDELTSADNRQNVGSSKTHRTRSKPKPATIQPSHPGEPAQPPSGALATALRAARTQVQKK